MHMADELSRVHTMGKTKEGALGWPQGSHPSLVKTLLGHPFPFQDWLTYACCQEADELTGSQGIILFFLVRNL